MACVFSIGLFADDTTCRVYGSKDNVVVTLESPIRVSERGHVSTYVTLTKEATEDISVVVRVYDAQTRECVATKTVSITKGHKSACTNEISVPENGKTYYLRIASASCQ